MVTYSTVIFFCERDQILKLLKIVCLCERRIILYDTRDGYVYLSVCVYEFARMCACVWVYWYIFEHVYILFFLSP